MFCNSYAAAWLLAAQKMLENLSVFTLTMKKLITLLALIGLFASQAALATTFTFTPSGNSSLEADPDDLNDLDHYYYYKWKINWTVPTGETIVGATLFLNNIKNWDNQANVLYIHLIDRSTVGSGVSSGSDNQGGGDFFLGKPLIGTLTNLNTTARDVWFDLGGSVTQSLDQGSAVSGGNRLADLASFAADGKFTLGFDPDCHYYNDGVQFTIETRRVPDSSFTGFLLTLGLLGIGMVRRAARD